MLPFKLLSTNLAETWNQKSISRQFKLASVTLLGLVTGVTLTSLISLHFVRQKTELTMLKCVELQQLVFKMNQVLEETNELEQGFFEEILTLGVERARQNHLKYHDKNVTQIQEISQQISQLIREQNFSQKLRESHEDLLAYNRAIEQYNKEFSRADIVAENLGNQNIGLITKNQEMLQLLHENIQYAGNLDVIEAYHDLIANAQAYFLTRKPLEKENLNQVMNRLQELIEVDLYLTNSEKQESQKYLDRSKFYFEKISALEDNINQISEQFHQDSEAISNQLLSLSNEEIKLAHQDIRRTSQQMTVILVSSIIAMVSLSLVIWRSFQSALKQLEIEQEKSERLLLNILPEPIAFRLKNKPGTIADNFEEVTVLFADIAGFTQLSAKISPIELVNLLNEIFSEFDQITTQNKLEKIKTIGDAYLVVGGLPKPRRDHAEAIAKSALEMQKKLIEFNQKNHQNLQIRIGINTGPVVAGVIGAKKFIYDLWGDTVNIASRMESHGIIGEIQVTETTYQHLKDKYKFEKRGLINVKGKGEMSTYLLKGTA
ncbi:MAG: adenylate/guanylate cyclase domain-containing protein [Lyngbya sp.]|nr:adenylate/guanylate cyclase domain-containing protein [Lyngbya sp.]